MLRVIVSLSRIAKLVLWVPAIVIVMIGKMIKEVSRWIRK